MQESHFFGLFLVHQEVDGLALIAEFTLRVSDLRTYICQIRCSRPRMPSLLLSCSVYHLFLWNRMNIKAKLPIRLTM